MPSRFYEQNLQKRSKTETSPSNFTYSKLKNENQRRILHI